MSPLAELVFTAMVLLAPPERLAALPAYPGHSETGIERRSRYAVIAYEIAEVVESEPPLPGFSRRGTAAVLTGLAWMEGGFSHDADVGPVCAAHRCDQNRAASLWQIQAPAEDRARLFADRPYAIKRALDLARRSFIACAPSGQGALLSGYAAGSCESIIGRAQSRARLAAGAKVELLFARGL